jgi:hypothetical protein
MSSAAGQSSCHGRPFLRIGMIAVNTLRMNAALAHAPEASARVAVAQEVAGA